MKFLPGDEVKFLNEVGEGVVVRMQGSSVIISDKDGFEYPVQASDLLLIKRPETRSEAVETSSKVNEEEKNKANTVPKKKYPGFVPGLYLTFAPDNEKVPIAEGGQIFLVNYTGKAIFYQLFFAGSSIPEAHHSIVKPHSADLIADYSPEDLRNLKNVSLLSIPISEKREHLCYSSLIQMEIKTARFQKEDNYNDNPFFDFSVLSILLESESGFEFVKSAEDSKVKIRLEQDTVVTGAKNMIDPFIVEDGFAEVDLHIEKIRADYKNIPDDQKMIIQLSYFRQALEAAIEKELKRIVFIHGVGVGMLKSELYKILKQYSNLRYGDASFRVYGIGATEVEIV